MTSQIFNIIITGANAVYNWFNNILSSTGFMPYLMIVLSVSVVIRFFINPMLKRGFGKSDSVSKNYNKENE